MPKRFVGIKLEFNKFKKDLIELKSEYLDFYIIVINATGNSLYSELISMPMLSM
jgi:hypothetical protein